MSVFNTRLFHQWAEEINLTDDMLNNAIYEIVAGLFEANLGGNVYKKRVGIAGCGKSGGVRTLIAYRLGDKAIFMYGFAKNKRANITKTEKLALRKLAKLYFNYTDKEIGKSLISGELIEVKNEQIDT